MKPTRAELIADARALIELIHAAKDVHNIHTLAVDRLRWALEELANDIRHGQFKYDN